MFYFQKVCALGLLSLLTLTMLATSPALASARSTPHLIPIEFSPTCRDFQIQTKWRPGGDDENDTWLQANCQDDSGSYQNTQISLDEHLANQGGDVSYTPTAPGNFTDTCTYQRLEGGHILKVGCKYNGSDYRDTSIDLDQYITNNNGTLKWISN
ncbi:MAG TPA: CVNH domain-containing protein [Ktedonosporobacter sp.]|nr:CVNH domain-containing protein [Ktedonosporobacter sp.]